MSESVGGYRVGAGRPSQWQRPTKMIRLPAEFEAELLAIAHKLDQGNSLRCEEVTFTLDELNLAIAAVLIRLPPRDRRDANRLFKKLVARLRES